MNNDKKVSSADTSFTPRKRTSSKVVHNDSGMPIGIECRCGKTILLDEEIIPIMAKKCFAHSGYTENGLAFSLKTKIGPRHFAIQNLILKPSAGMVVDHINSNPHDNRRINLRECTPKQNSKNRQKRPDNKSGYIGVSWKTKNRKWVAQYVQGKTRKHIGLFDSAEEAAIARDNFVHIEYGGFAKLNFPERFGITYP